MPQCATPLGPAQQQQRRQLKKLQFPRPSFGHFHFMTQHRGNPSCSASSFSLLLSPCYPSLLSPQGTTLSCFLLKVSWPTTMGTFFKVFFIVALTDRNDRGRGSSSRRGSERGGRGRGRGRGVSGGRRATQLTLTLPRCVSVNYC